MSSSEEPLTKIFRRAGCGKSARPVRDEGRGTLGVLSYSTGQFAFFSSLLNLLPAASKHREPHQRGAQ